MTHTCTNNSAHCVQRAKSCAILVIYCNIFFIYVFLRWQEFMCHVQRFNIVEVHSVGGKMFLIWSCNVGMSKFSFCFVATWGQQTSKSMWWFSSLSSGVNCCVGRKPTRRCIKCFICCRRDRVKLCFLEQCCFKTVCMLRRKKTTKFTVQGRTHWRLCTIVILLMCKYNAMFGMLLLFISCKWKEKATTKQYVSLRVPSTSWQLKPHVFSKAAFYYVKIWLK